jgi:hypothetical protein
MRGWWESKHIPGMDEVIRRFDRDTGWLAAGILAALVSAALVLALIQDHHAKEPTPTNGMQAVGNPFLDTNVATLFLPFVKDIRGRVPGPEVCRACDIAIF